MELTMKLSLEQAALLSELIDDAIEQAEYKITSIGYFDDNNEKPELYEQLEQLRQLKIL